MTQAKNVAIGGSNFDSSGKLSLTAGVTGTLPAANGGTGTTTFPSPGTSGNALISNGTVWTSTAISTKPFVTGTSMLFRQTAAPTGWTKVTTLNDYALRVVSGTAGTGGTVAFTTAFASQAVSGTVGTSGSTSAGGTVGATTLSSAQMPSHNHTFSVTFNGCGIGAQGGGTDIFYGNKTTNSTGGGGSHDHSFSGSSHTHTGGTFTGTAINLAVQYVDVIIANID